MGPLLRAHRSRDRTSVHKKTLRECGKCGVLKPLSEFDFRFKERGIRQWNCKSCASAYKRDWYLRNREHQLARVKAGRERRRTENRIRLWEYLAGKMCVDCGERDPLVLEFDHLRDKRREVSKMILDGFVWNEILAEIQKCEIRCANCHRRKTLLERGAYLRKLRGIIDFTKPRVYLACGHVRS